MRYLLPLTLCASLVALSVHTVAASERAKPHPARLTIGSGSNCQAYEIGSINNGQEIADMLNDASTGARLSGCVALIVKKES